jgi:glycosyltransferase involved in cell wall biosynthesis
MLRDRGVPATIACTGRAIDMRHPGYMEELKTFIADNNLQDRIKLLGVVAPDVLVNLFRYAAAVVQPSLFEGWSTVVEDTKALGRPLFLTDLPVHREQAAAGALAPFHFYPPGDATALADAIAAAWPTLALGPDTAVEADAEATRRLRAQASARAFVAIMKDMKAAK